VSRPSKPTNLPVRLSFQATAAAARCIFCGGRPFCVMNCPVCYAKNMPEQRRIILRPPQSRVGTAFQAFLYFLGIVLILLVKSMRIEF
jgi:polyferredoxin